MKYDRKLIVANGEKVIIAKDMRVLDGRPRVGEKMILEFDAKPGEKISPVLLSWLHNGQEITMEASIVSIAKEGRHTVYGICRSAGSD